MVCLCIAGGGLTQQDVQSQLDQAARLHAEGEISRAADLYRQVLKQSPQQPDALHMMGVIAQQGGNPQLALQFIEAALAAKPDFARAWFNRSVILRVLGRSAEALQSARMAAESEPGLAEVWDMIGQILKDDGKLAEAAECHRRAIELQPGNAHFHGNYAALLLVMGDPAAAYLAARQAAACDVAWPPLPLGNILYTMGYPLQAAEQFARARALYSHPTEVVVNEAVAHLQMGDFEQGWDLWEQRPEFASPLNAIPLWRGQKVSRLLLHEEQGFGDLIQWLRYVPLLRTRAARIDAYVRAPLRRLCQENFPYLHFLDEDAPVSSAEARCRWSSFAFFFDTRLDNIPSTPYLAASAERRAFWRDKLRDMPRPRIGLVWAGGKNFMNDAQRSLSADSLHPVIACGAAHFVSIQKGRPEKLAGIFDAAPDLEDFADTAALIEELDLVISVDTSTAHLAGALGKPVFILLPFGSDWRWFLGREDSPWYPTGRLFRQRKLGDWAGVIGAVTGEVQKLIAGDRSILQPVPWRGESLRQNPDALPLPE